MPYLEDYIPAVRYYGLNTRKPTNFVGNGQYNVKAYGAKGNGTTDDTAAIQAAIDAIGNTGGTVFFPPGVYLISEPLTYNSYSSNYSYPAPNLIGSPGRAGPSLDFATDETEWETTCSHMLKASDTFPTGEFMIDWIGSNAQDRSICGFRISGFVLNCNGRAAGMRVINPFSASIADIVIDNEPATPNPAFEPEKRDGTGDLNSTGALTMLGVPTQNSFYNTIERVYIREAAQDGMHLASGSGSYDLVNMCCVNNSGRYGYNIETKAHVFNSLAQANAEDSTANGADWKLGQYNVMIVGGGSFSGKPIYGNGLRITGGANGNQKAIGMTLYGGENPENNMAANACAAIQVTGALMNFEMVGCHIFSGVNTFTSHFIYVSASASGSVSATACQFSTAQGSALTGAKISANGKDSLLHISNCDGLNPEGLIQKGNITGAVTFDASTGNVQTGTLTGNITATIPNGDVVGQLLTLILTQDGTGNRTMTSPSNLKKAGGTFTLSTGAGAVDTIVARWDGTYWREISRSLDLS